MNCPNCSKEYFVKDQKICEYCGSDLINETQTHQATEKKHESKSKLDSFLDDLGLKNVYNRIKKNLREL
ncbi:MAG: hypothetical protein EU531_02350 [Promethearchaeota archaeon]|nr:MAG: hypothetical protein EU531_02350 [Candidatus Lokiarchaeota archaeon]